MNSVIPPNESVSSVFQENVCIRGDLELKQPLLFNGKIYGNIRSESHVIIGEKGYVEGQITAENVTMWGEIKGDVISEETCILQNVACVQGDITSARLVMKEGSSFVGQARIRDDRTKDVVGTSAASNRLEKHEDGVHPSADREGIGSKKNVKS